MGTGEFATGPGKGRRLSPRLSLRRDPRRRPARVVSLRARGRINGDQHQFRLALCDDEALTRTEEYLRQLRESKQTDSSLRPRQPPKAPHERDSHSEHGSSVEEVRRLIAWPERSSAANGTRASWPASSTPKAATARACSRISNTDGAIIGWIETLIARVEFSYVVEHVRSHGHQADRRGSPDWWPVASTCGSFTASIRQSHANGTSRGKR